MLWMLLGALVAVPMVSRGDTGAPPAAAPVAPAAPGGGAELQASNNFSFVRYRADYAVRADAGNVQTEEYEILLKTKAAVEQFSQVRLSYSEKMETLEVLAAYTLTADGQRRDVPADRIYTQESYSSASAAMYADRKVQVVVFPNLAPGTRVVYTTRRTQNQPYFPGYFGLWETFSVFTQYDDAQVTLSAPASLPMFVQQRGVQGSQAPTIRDGVARWAWHYRRDTPMQVQNWSAAPWEFSPTIMASTYRDWAQVARAYQLKGGQAAEVTPAIQALADQLTAGIADRREQAAALYRWVAQNIRYVAVYLGNGGLEPNPAQSILDNHYGDCKDHVVILEALLAARGIHSSAVLIGAGGGPSLPEIPLLGRFNHAITYIPEFDLFLDSTSPYARFGQLPEGDLGAPVLLTRTATLARTPENDARRNGNGLEVSFRFDARGNLAGQTVQQPSAVTEIGMRSSFARLNAQNRARVEESIMASSGFDGTGALTLLGDPQDLVRPFNYRYDFHASDYVDFSVVGGMPLPDAPGAESVRDIYATTSAPDNQAPFYCTDNVREETYRLEFPAGVPIVAIPRSQRFANPAGEYTLDWSREGQVIVARHRLHQRALRGPQALCQPGDYAAFRALYQQVRRGFRGQVVYGDLRTVQANP
ncbi:MAG TPA: transglutaminase [Stenotrophomonas sp.]|nr:transglutaminase [Stenotrophomonas sp.]